MLFSGEKSALVKKEERERDSVSFSAYIYLLCAGSWPFVVSIITFGWSQVFLLGKDFWLVYWSEQGERHSNWSQQDDGYFNWTEQGEGHFNWSKQSFNWSDQGERHFNWSEQGERYSNMSNVSINGNDNDIN